MISGTVVCQYFIIRSPILGLLKIIIIIKSKNINFPNCIISMFRIKTMMFNSVHQQYLLFLKVSSFGYFHYMCEIYLMRFYFILYSFTVMIQSKIFRKVFNLYTSEFWLSLMYKIKIFKSIPKRIFFLSIKQKDLFCRILLKVAFVSERFQHLLSQP